MKIFFIDSIPTSGDKNAVLARRRWRPFPSVLQRCPVTCGLCPLFEYERMRRSETIAADLIQGQGRWLRKKSAGHAHGRRGEKERRRVIVR